MGRRRIRRLVDWARTRLRLALTIVKRTDDATGFVVLPRRLTGEATTTRTGLRVEAELDTRTYNTGMKVTDAEINALAMARHRFHGDWNYTLHPADPYPAPSHETETENRRCDDRPADCAPGRH